MKKFFEKIRRKWIEKILGDYRLKLYAHVPDNGDMIFYDLSLARLLYLTDLRAFDNVPHEQKICLTNVTKITIEKGVS